MIKTIKPAHSLSGEVSVPGDKSISIRAVLFSSIAEGTSVIRGLSAGGDVQSALKCVQALGTAVRKNGDDYIIDGKGLYGFRKPEKTLDVGNSGTTIRLLTGILAGQKFSCEITGDASIQKRPMDRIVDPLRQMGAQIKGRDNGKMAPLSITGSKLKGIHYHTTVASAQVKSCILLAGLYAEGKTTVTEPACSRDHTERMLASFGAEVEVQDRSISVTGGPNLKAKQFRVPGDISAAAFFLAASLIVPDAELIIPRVCLNPTRTGILDALCQMGGNISISAPREESGELMGDLTVSSSHLSGIEISGVYIPRVIDEIPILAVCATQAQGKTEIRDAKELRIKETDRITAITANLRKMGAEIEELPDGIIINGPTKLHGAELNCFHDHRIAMTFAVAGLCAEGKTVLNGAEWADISFPGFFKQIGILTNNP